MFRVLVPVDGSECSERAVRFLIKKAGLFAEPLDIHLINVQHPFPGTIQGVHTQAQQVHREEGEKTLAAARRLLDAAGIKYQFQIGVGEAAEVIAREASERSVEQVVMGTHGRGAVTGLLMGSVAMKVLHLVKVPVLLVK